MRSFQGEYAAQIAVSELRVIERFIPTDKEIVVFDVGANAGEWSKAVLANNAKAEIHLFEPQPSLVPRLYKNLSKYIDNNQIFISNAALSDDQRFVNFHLYAEDLDSGLSSIHRRTSAEASGLVGPPSRQCIIPTKTLDTYCHEMGIHRIDFLKIDTEGHELSVLKGSQRMISSGDIDFIQFEYGGTYLDSGATLKDVFCILQFYNYRIFKITNKSLLYVEQYTSSIDDYQYANYLAIHDRFIPLLTGNMLGVSTLSELFEANGIKPKGVIHIGAHEGQEYEEYVRMGFQKILFVEANPYVFERLQAKLKGKPNVILACCAISDHIGKTYLRVTSMDQSSSLLELKKHREIYPSIQEIQQLSVHATTVDALLCELKLDKNHFNFLNIDIQGAELMALKGSSELMPYLDAINTEVNFAELYKGCPLLRDIDNHLCKQYNFKRVKLQTPYSHLWGDAFYVKKPFISMATLGHNGRFGNQLFQYLFLKCYAKDNNLEVQVPPWAGNQLFATSDPVPKDVRLAFRQSEESIESGKPMHPSSLANHDIWGYFQYHTSYYSSNKQYIRELFEPVGEVAEYVSTKYQAMTKGHETIVGIHLRRGDYVEHNNYAFYPAPAEWYISWLKSFWHTLETPLLYLASDDLRSVQSSFSEFRPITINSLEPRVSHLDYYLDFYILSKCNMMAISNSTYSFTASMLNSKSTIFARPSRRARQLIPFDPWNSHVLLRENM